MARHPALRSACRQAITAAMIQWCTAMWRCSEWVDASGIEARPTRDCWLPAATPTYSAASARRAPLMRLDRVAAGRPDHYLIWTHHHLILDGCHVAGTSEIVAEIEADGPIRLQVIRRRLTASWLTGCTVRTHCRRAVLAPDARRMDLEQASEMPIIADRPQRFEARTCTVGRPHACALTSMPAAME